MPPKRTFKKYDKDTVEKAAEEVKEGNLSYREAEAKYGVDKMVIKRTIVHDGVYKPSGKSTLLPPKVEEKLAKHLVDRASKNIGLTKMQTRVKGMELLKAYSIGDSHRHARKSDSLLGKKWFNGFRQRNNLSVKKPQGDMSGTAMSIKEEPSFTPFPEEDVHAAHEEDISNDENGDPNEDQNESEDDDMKEQSDSSEDDEVEDPKVDKRFKCQFCPQAYGTLHLVRLHLKVSHADEEFVKNMFKVEEQYNQTRGLKYPVKEEEPKPSEQTEYVIVCSGRGKKPFKCTLCHNTYASRGSVIRHIELNHSNKAGDESSSEEETENISKEPEEYKCSFCPNVYSCNGNVLRHIRLSHSKTEDQECDSAKETVSTIVKEEPEGVKEPDFKCPFCPKEYFTKRSVGRHVEAQHPHEFEEFNLRNQKKIELKKEIVENEKAIMDDEEEVYKPFKCPLCPMKYAFRRSVDRHVESNHPTVDPKTVIKEKENKETNQIRFSCSLCSNSYTRSGDLRRHERDHHNPANKFVCSICNQRFETENKLKHHHSSIHSKGNPFKCDQCDKAFKNQGALLWHQKTHNDPRPTQKIFTCPVTKCKFRTDRENNLKRHSMTHTNIRDFSCNVCHKQFRCRVHVKRHVEGVHSDVNMFARVCRAWFVNRAKQMKLERERDDLKLEKERELSSKLPDEEEDNLSDAF